MAENDEEVLKKGYMTKRSQNKKIYTPVNYKQRWFVLNRKFFIYYDCDNEEKRKEKGRVELENIHSVEASLVGNCIEDNRPQGVSYPFQIGYQEYNQDYVLHLLASSLKERTDWILALRANTIKTYAQGIIQGIGTERGGIAARIPFAIPRGAKFVPFGRPLPKKRKT